MAKKVTTKEVAVAKNESTGLIESTNSMSAMATHLKMDKALFGGYEASVDAELFSNDIIIPKIWLTQQMSETFKNGVAKLGEYVSSATNEVLGDGKEPLRLVVLKVFKRWHTFSLDAKGNKEFLSSELYTTKNANLPYEDVIDGKDVVRRQVISAYVLRTDDIMKGLNVPYIIDFASTSKGAGRQLVSDVATIERAGYPAFVGYFNLTSKEETKDKNDFYVKVINFAGYLDVQNDKLMSHLMDCYNHIKLSADALKPDDSDLINKDETLDDLDDKARKASAEV